MKIENDTFIINFAESDFEFANTVASVLDLHKKRIMDFFGIKTVPQKIVIKIYNNLQEYKKMLYAFNCMKWGRLDGERIFKYNSRLYQKLKEKFSVLRIIAMSSKNPMSGKIWICNFELEESKIWDSNLPIPDGWIKGRHSKKQFKKLKK